ncbi:uncharacterized protein B0H64DRAFT_444226 [Chaetomium fimeti]|uniref:Uncharacterized protein n=1 Tax=Chaetomium fimeti TaxID=1854472 RepID=A0AAE0HC63_9PEZI|nr:hypothetical protein B0H64DRAFT_444226 [Chaetomium fimeti]
MAGAPPADAIEAVPTADVEIEKRIYRWVGRHPNIVHSVGIDEGGIHLERAKDDSLSQYFKEGGTSTRGACPVDIGGQNILLDAGRTIKVCGFAGSSIDDIPHTVVAQDGFRHPDDDEAMGDTLRAEIHALGFTIFEIMTSTCPHWCEEEETGMALDLMRKDVYCDIDGVVLGCVISACWEGNYVSAEEVAEGIEVELQRCGSEYSHYGH